VLGVFGVGGGKGNKYVTFYMLILYLTPLK